MEKETGFSVQDGYRVEQLGCRVLLVEDDLDDQIFSQRELENSGYVGEVRCFPDGEELVRFMRGQGLDAQAMTNAAPTIIIVDINMPRMDGFTVLEKLKSNPLLEEIPVVVLSGDLSYESIRRALDLRADGVLRKPLNIQKVAEYLKHGWHWPARDPWPS
ncbi:MAG TPA: response regulator [Patescibacteria group bacterium]|nr:response regulator [Patescibacteria group bacterium]